MKPLFYIHTTACISPQQTFGVVDIDALAVPESGKLTVIEAPGAGIPPAMLRRMSKAVRMGMCAGLHLLKGKPAPDGIIIGTANAGMEDCFYFFKQLIDYEEGILTPGSFVQSTPSALAAQLAMRSNNHGYNVTHVHLGLAFENAITDAAMSVNEHPENNYLLGAVDDISAYNYALNLLAGWYKNEVDSSTSFYGYAQSGAIAGEGAAMFWVNGNAENAAAKLQAAGTVHSGDEIVVLEKLKSFLDKNLPEGETIDLLLSGENGDNRFFKFYSAAASVIPTEAGIARFKHLCGEYPTATAFALWLACHLFQNNVLPAHMIERRMPARPIKNILIFNDHKGTQHSFLLVKGI